MFCRRGSTPPPGGQMQHQTNPTTIAPEPFQWGAGIVLHQQRVGVSPPHKRDVLPPRLHSPAWGKTNPTSITSNTNCIQTTPTGGGNRAASIVAWFESSLQTGSSAAAAPLPRLEENKCNIHYCNGRRYMGTSLIRNRAPQDPTVGPMVALRGVAVSCEPGNPVITLQ